MIGSRSARSIQVCAVFRTAQLFLLLTVAALGLIGLGCEGASWLVAVSNNGLGTTGLLLFVHIEQGETSGYRAEDENFIGEELVIRDAAAWARLWQAHRPGTVPPRIDFAREMVLAAFMGRQDLGCDAVGIRVASVTQAAQQLEVVIEEARPDGGEECRANPYDFVRCARTGTPVSFVHTAPDPEP